MTKAKILAVTLITATSLAAPIFSAVSYASPRHDTANAYARGSSAKRLVGACIRAPRVGAFATQPWTNGPPCEPNWTY
jgi:hypothetical protein